MSSEELVKALVRLEDEVTVHETDGKRLIAQRYNANRRPYVGFWMGGKKVAAHQLASLSDGAINVIIAECFN